MGHSLAFCYTEFKLLSMELRAYQNLAATFVSGFIPFHFALLPLFTQQGPGGFLHHSFFNCYALASMFSLILFLARPSLDCKLQETQGLTLMDSLSLGQCLACSRCSKTQVSDSAHLFCTSGRCQVLGLEVPFTGLAFSSFQI